ncbi:hypothetical protein WAF17_20925 [Bernardetia sp. ABR2-2B]|uniref:hypothetical protein n=1 Tax=Bernardetia sp. ABR2-2B TaxID=3127472 RepID=UPI0030D17C56
MTITKGYIRLAIVIVLTLAYGIIAFHLPEYVHPNQLNNVGFYIDKNGDMYNYIIGISILIHFVFSLYYLRNYNLKKTDGIKVFFFSLMLIMAYLFFIINILNIISLYNIQYTKVEKAKLINKHFSISSGKQKTKSYYCVIRYENGKEKEIYLSDRKGTYAPYYKLREGMSISVYHYKGRLSNVKQLIIDDYP